MDRAACVETLVNSAKRLKISTPALSQTHHASQKRWSHNVNATSSIRQRQHISRAAHQTTRSASALATSQASKQETEQPDVRLPKNVQAVFLQPLRRAPTHGIPVCDLQIRSYSVRNLEAFADFCMRAAYYLKLAAKGPVPLPRITERWTVPRSNFVHKKSQENFERITMRRLIQIQDGHPETVAIWLAYIQKQRYYGVGLKANVFEHGKLDVVSDMDGEGARISKMLGENWPLFTEENPQLKDSSFDGNEILDEPYKAQWGADAPMSGLGKQSRGSQLYRRTRYIDNSAADTTRQAKESQAEEEKASGDVQPAMDSPTEAKTVPNTDETSTSPA